MYFYSAYGLTIRSELALPELMEQVGHAICPDVGIRWGIVPHPVDFFTSERHIWSSPTEAIFFWDDVGTLLARNGQEVVIDPLPDVTEEVLRLFVLGTALGTLLHQRKLLVLHASAIAVQGEAIAFIGESGWGKSTTAATFCLQGYQAVADDVVAIDFDAEGKPIVLPGFPQFKLWSDAIAALGYDPETLPRLRPELDKYGHRVPVGFSLDPLPLRQIYVLGGGNTFAIEPIPAQAAFLELVRHSYALRSLRKDGLNANHFRHATQLVKRVPVSRLVRQRSLSDLQEIIRLVEHDLANLAHPVLV
jgi:hypothetical protein